MKSVKYLAPFAVAVLVLSPAAFAKNKNEGNFSLNEAARVGTTELQPGNYKAEWKQESGDVVKIDILQHGKPVATVEGKLKEMAQPSAYDAVTTKPLSDNTKAIEEIEFDSRKDALVIGE